jgi:hypothetical protein
VVAKELVYCREIVLEAIGRDGSGPGEPCCKAKYVGRKSLEWGDPFFVAKNRKKAHSGPVIVVQL